MGNAFDDLPPGLPEQAAAPVASKANAFDDITPPIKAEAPKKPVSWEDRVQAHQAGAFRGLAYTVASPVDAVANLYNLGKAGLGAAYQGITGKTGWDVGDANPVGGWLSAQMDKFHDYTPTTVDRPDDTASRYIAGVSGAIPAVATGAPSIGAGLKTFAKAAPAVAAGQAVGEAQPFGDQEWANNAASIATQLGASYAMPRGRGADVPGNDVRNQTIRDAQDAGMVFPPATTNPSGGNRLVENIGGKQQIQQHATLTNRDAVNAAARDALGIDGKGGISESELSDVRASAKPAYEAVRQIGDVPTGSDPAFSRTLTGVLNKYTGAGRVLSNAGDSGIRADITDILSKKSADASDLVDTIDILRDRASTAFRNGDSGIGSAYRRISNAIEDQLENNIAGKSVAIPALADRVSGAISPSAPAKSAVQNFRDARQRLAIAHTIEDARNEGSGDINAQKLTGMYHNGVPLQGGLATAAKAAALAPKAFAPVTDSRGVNHLGFWGGVGGAAMTAHEIMPEAHSGMAALAVPVTAAAYKGARTGARMYALGPGQKNAIAAQKGPIDTNALIANYLAAMSRQ